MIIPVKQIPHWAEISVWMQFDLVGILNQFLSSLQEATAQILVHSVVFEKALPPKKEIDSLKYCIRILFYSAIAYNYEQNF